MTGETQEFSGEQSEMPELQIDNQTQEDVTML